MEIQVTHLFTSLGHDFFGRHGKGRREYEICDQPEIELVAGRGIRGDRFFDHKENYKGQLTLFDGAVWDAVKGQFSLPELPASHFRRNVVIRGVDLSSLIGESFQISDLVFSGSEESKPCYWMNEACAPGVEEFLKGQGGLRCRIVKGGILRVGTHHLSVI